MSEIEASPVLGLDDRMWPIAPETAPSVSVQIKSVLIKWAVGLLFVAFALVLTRLAVGAFAGGQMSGDPTLAEDPEALVAALGLPMTVISIAVFFPALAAAALLWVRVAERRSLASAGFTGPAPLFRYGRGLIFGVMLAIVLLLVGGGLASALGVAEEPMGVFQFARLGEPAFLQLIAIAVALLLVQSASEEIVCRGWMLSSLAMRTGLMTAIIGSSVWFGFLHGDRVAIDPVMGLFVIAGTATVGVSFARWALAEQGIYGVCGAHGGYNATLVVIFLVVAIATGEADTPAGLVDEVVTGLVDEIAAPGAWTFVVAQIGVFGLLAIFANALFARRTSAA